MKILLSFHFHSPFISGRIPNEAMYHVNFVGCPTTEKGKWFTHNIVANIPSRIRRWLP